MLRIGVLSTAKIAREQLIPAIQLASNAKLQAVSSRSAKAAQNLAERFNVPLAFGSYEALLESDEIDAVYIPLPTSDHVSWTEKALQAGKHVLCEKPIALKAADVKKLIRARDRSGCLVSEAFMITYHPQWLQVRSLIAKGRIGRLRRIQGVFSYFNKDPDNMRNQPKLGGGALPDIGVYPILAARFASQQEPQQVRAQVDYDPEFGTDCLADVHLEFSDFTVNFYVSTQLALRQTMVFHGDKGVIEVAAPFNSNLYEGDEVRLHTIDHKEVRVFRYTGINQYRLQTEAFARAVQNRNKPHFTLEDSWRNQSVIDAIYQSGKTGKKVKLNGM